MEKDETPLHRAMKHSNRIDQEKVVKKIISYLSAQNRLDEIDATTKEGNTPLLIMCRADNDASNIVEILLGLGAEVDKQNNKGETALYLAAGSNSLEKVTMLLHFGANPNIANHSGCGPLGKAARNGNKPMIDILIRAGAQLDTFKDAMLREAAKGGYHAIMQWLLEREANINGQSSSFGNTPLHKAVEYKQLRTVRFLLERGAKTKAKNKQGDTPLDYALTISDHEITALLKEWLWRKLSFCYPLIFYIRE